MKRYVILSGALAVLAVGCSRNNGPTQATMPATLSLHAAETGDIGGVAVQMIRVDGDSRCPSGVQCIWAGDATVVITVRTPGSPAASLAQQFLHTNIEPRSVTVDGYRVKLDSLKPYPVAGQAIPQSEYIAFLTVSRLTD